MPVAGAVGVRFALEPGQGRTSVPVRSAMVGTVLAVTVVLSALTFAASLSTLVSHPPLYGWNWDYMFDTTNDVPPQSLSALDHDPDVAAWSGADLVPFQIDGQFVPSVVASPHARVAPPILSGHGLDADNEIVVGSATLAELHKHVGDTVYLSEGTPKSAPFYIPPTPTGRRRDRHVPRHRLLEHHRQPALDGHRGPGPRRCRTPGVAAHPDEPGPHPQRAPVRVRAVGQRGERRRPAWPTSNTSPAWLTTPSTPTPERRGTTASASWECNARPRSSTTARSGRPRWSWPPGSPPGPSSPSVSP